MRTRMSHGAAASCALFGLGSVLAFGAAASAGPDLVVSRDYTRIEFGGCAIEEPLASGVATIANIGDRAADLPLGVIDQYGRSLVAVYVPEHLDLLDYGRGAERLEAGETVRAPFEIGVGNVKAGRLVDERAFDGGDPAPIEALGPEAIMEYQRALADLEFYELAIDGVPGPGFREAVEFFQAATDRPQTGVLTIDDARRLAEQSGRPLRTGAERAPGERRVTLYVVADPYNLVAEDNEANNLEIWNGIITCP